MTDALIEAVARALHAKEWEHVGTNKRAKFGDVDKPYWMESARAAIAAIEASGTHVVVPSALTDQMLSALHDQAAASLEAYGVPLSIPDRWKDICHDQYAAMLAARPKVLE